VPAFSPGRRHAIDSRDSFYLESVIYGYSVETGLSCGDPGCDGVPGHSGPSLEGWGWLAAHESCLLGYPPCFNSTSTCLAISFRVSKTPLPFGATASMTASFFLRSSAVSLSMGSALGKSRLLSCRT
jgi:hypothetical protein